MRSPEGIKVSPNPAEAGGSVTISGSPSGTVYVGYRGTIQAVKLDKRGAATVPVPGQAGEEFTVSDGIPPRPSNVIVKIVANMPSEGRT